MMLRYRAEELLAMNEDDLWALPDERHVVIFTDGELETHKRATVFSVYLWYPFTRYPNKNLLRMEHHIQDQYVNSKLINQLINKCNLDILADSGETYDPEELSRYAIEAVNRIFNVMTVRCSASVTTLSMFDVLEVADHPDIVEANAKVEPTPDSIENMAYPAIIKALKDEVRLKANPISLGVRAGTLTGGNMTQSFGPRGFTTDYDSGIFPNPVMTGFVEGIWDPHDSLVESRSGTKALLYNKELLRNTEYFNRKTQLIAQYVQRLHPGDCGTPHYLEVPVLKNLLKHMAGKYYIREDGVMDWLRGNETHLIGKKIRMRSVMGCTHPDPAGVCSKCYGRMSFSVPRQTNIGWVSAVTVCDMITSIVLSTKHQEASSKIDRFQLHATEAKYLKYGSADETLYLKSVMRNRPMKMILERDEVQALTDVLLIKDLSAYPPTNASALTKVGIEVETSQGTIVDVLNVSLYNRKSSLSREVLEYIQRKRWTLDERGNVVVDMEGFDIDKPFLVLPHKHVNMYEVMKQYQSFLHSGTEGEKTKLGSRRFTGRSYLKNYKDHAEALIVFATMLNEKLSVNINHCDVLLYAMTAANPTQKDFRLAVPGVSGVFEKYSKLMYERSLAGAMAYERQHYSLNAPSSFNNHKRNDHPYDTIVLGGKMD